MLIAEHAIETDRPPLARPDCADCIFAERVARANYRCRRIRSSGNVEVDDFRKLLVATLAWYGFCPVKTKVLDGGRGQRVGPIRVN